MEVITVNVLCKSQWACWGGEARKQKPAPTLLCLGFVAVEIWHMEGPSPKRVLGRRSDGSIIARFFDCSSCCHSPGSVNFYVGPHSTN